MIFCCEFVTFGISINNQENMMVKNSKCYSLSRVQLFATPWAASCQASLSMEFSRQEYWSGFPFPSPGDLPDPGTEPGFPAWQADSFPSKPPGKHPNQNILTLERKIVWKYLASQILNYISQFIKKKKMI